MAATYISFILAGLFVWLLLAARKRQAIQKKQLDNYSSIIDQANDAMLVIDIADGKIHQCNPSAATLLGYTTAELTRLSLFDLHPTDRLAESSSLVADVWEKGGLIFSDIPFVKKNNDLVPVECSARVAPFAGRPAIVIYARDISERLRLEREISEQRRLIDEKNKDISDSIDYSKRIQRSLLPDMEKMKVFVPESFIYFQPRDVVSGDFYWFINYQLNNDVTSETGYVYKKGAHVLVVAAVDCTGHGVPGAFMSIIGSTLLDQTTRNPEIRSPANALDHVNAGLKKHLNKSDDVPLRDGMDIALCSIDLDGHWLEYAGANNPIYVVRDGILMVLNADKQPLTASTDSESRSFTNQTLGLQPDDCIYLFTDGYADQFGGDKEKKYLYKRFKEFLVEISPRPMSEQKDLLRENFTRWKGSFWQVDDVLVIGIRITAR